MSHKFVVYYDGSYDNYILVNEDVFRDNIWSPDTNGYFKKELITLHQERHFVMNRQHQKRQKAERNNDGSFVLDGNGEPIIKYKMVDAKPEDYDEFKSFSSIGYDFSYEVLSNEYTHDKFHRCKMQCKQDIETYILEIDNIDDIQILGKHFDITFRQVGYFTDHYLNGEKLETVVLY